MAVDLLRCLRLLDWETVVLEPSEDRSFFYVVGFCDRYWRVTLRSGKGRQIPFPDCTTEKRIARGIAGEAVLEDCGEGFLSLTIPISCETPTSCPETKEYYSEDGGVTWTVVVD